MNSNVVYKINSKIQQNTHNYIDTLGRTRYHYVIEILTKSKERTGEYGAVIILSVYDLASKTAF